MRAAEDGNVLLELRDRRRQTCGDREPRWYHEELNQLGTLHHEVPGLLRGQHAVSVSDGYFNVNLGTSDAATTVRDSLASVPTRYLEITVEGEVLLPRHQITAVPWALYSN